jgi:hypothetical protein
VSPEILGGLRGAQPDRFAGRCGGHGVKAYGSGLCGWLAMADDDAAKAAAKG